MTENDIERMIAAEARTLRDEDSRHIEGLMSDLNADLQPWCARQRRLHTLLAIGLLVAVTTSYGLLLPTDQRPQVVCNQIGGNEAVMQCATQILTIS
ncbi:MAG: hypothetical protein J6V98_07010 [Bacteroidales bacterium]|nr:hypothetical protein [Bacteroidales bacterium]